MAEEFDVIAGFDFSALDTITGAQLMQAINQIAPLSNKGLVIFGPDAPDVVDNPRYARYLWTDTSATPYVIKYWDGNSWESITIGAGAITNTMIANYAVSIFNSTPAPKIARAFNAAADLTKANFLLRLDSNGQYVDIASLATILANGAVPLASLAPGTDNQFLRMNGVTVQWETVNIGAELTDGSVALSRLAAGTAGYIIRVSAGGVAEYVQYLPISNIDPSGFSALYTIRRNAANTAFEAALPVFSKEMVEVTAVGTLANGAFAHAHGLGAIIPKLVEKVLVCSTTEAGTGYTAGDETDSAIVSSVGDTDGSPIVAVARDTANLTVLINNAANGSIRHKTTGVYTAFNAANWKYRIRAWY